MTPDPARLLAALRARDATVAVAESLTAGLVCARLADAPGVSKALRGGVVVYATDLKATLGGVPAKVLDVHGPVSEPTARALASGVRFRLAATYGLAVTGVAGPDPQQGLPVGTVFAAISGPRDADQVRRLELTGDRAAIRRAAADATLQLLADTLAAESSD